MTPPILSMQGRPLEGIPSALGHAVAEELSLAPRERPLFQLAAQAIDIVSVDKLKAIQEILAFLATDVTCFWHTTPPDLRQKEVQTWGKLHYIISEYFKCKVATTETLRPLNIPVQTMETFRAHFEKLSIWHLSAFMTASRLTGSCIIPLAHLHGLITIHDAWEHALLEEHFQNQRWGVDEEALLRQKKLLSDLEILEKYTVLLGESSVSAQKL